MKDLLKKLSLEELRELGQKYLHDYSKKLNGNALVNKLVARGIDDADMQWIKEIAMSSEEKVAEANMQQAAKQEVQRIEPKIAVEQDGVYLTTAQVEAQTKLRGEQELAYLVAQAKKEASKTVIAYVSPLAREDLSINKTAEAFITGNAYFTISCVVPFNVYVEIPKCIAESIRETKMPIITELTAEQAARYPNQPASVFRQGKRYNIQITPKKIFEEQRDNMV